jgi:hypothetical protein
VETEAFGSLTLKDTIKILIKHFDLHEGLFDLAFEIQTGIGNFGPNKEATLPGAAIGVGGLKLVKSPKMGPHTVDAAEFNPMPLKSNKRQLSK